MTFGIDTPDHDSVPQDRSPIAAAHRVTIGEAQIQAEARIIRKNLDQRSADMRTAAILNALAVAKSHGMSPEWTEADVERLRNMLAMTDEIAAGANDGETVPQGFGPAVRARQTEALLRAVAKLPKTADAPGFTGGAANGDGAAAEGGP